MQDQKAEAEQRGKQVVLSVRNKRGEIVKPDAGLYFFSRSNTISTLIKQKIAVKGGEVTATIPIADTAPPKLKAVSGLFYHPGGWPGGIYYKEYHLQLVSWPTLLGVVFDLG